jgi:hypothetical protein
MPTPAQRDLLPAADAVRAITLARARNSLQYGVFGELETTGDTIQRIIEAVPTAIAGALPANAFIFVPLALGETSHARDTEIARVHTADLADRAICHRTLPIDGTTYTFVSTRLMQDRFALAFEYFINVGHHFVEAVGVPESFSELIWAQARADVRGETSHDAWESRRRALDKDPGRDSSHDTSRDTSRDAIRDFGREQGARRDSGSNQGADRKQGADRNHGADRSQGVGRDLSADRSADHAPGQLDEKARTSYYESAFADAIAIYMLSLTLDFDYTELREREYPLLAAPALAERLRHVSSLFPPNPGYDFEIRYRRRG